MLSKEDVDYNPVGLAADRPVIWILRSYPQEFKELVLVDVAGHILNDVCLEVIELEKFAKIHKVELVFIREAEVSSNSGDVLEQVTDVFVVLTERQVLILGLQIDLYLDLGGVFSHEEALVFIDFYASENFSRELPFIPLSDLY